MLTVINPVTTADKTARPTIRRGSFWEMFSFIALILISFKNIR
jgi:hypothetical protein